MPTSQKPYFIFDMFKPKTMDEYIQERGFANHHWRLVEQGINVDDKYLMRAYYNATMRYSPEELDLIIRHFELKNSCGSFHTPNGALCKALQKGWGL